MADLLVDLPTSFVIGLASPLASACVLPLFPGFLAYLSGQLPEKAKGSASLILGAIASAGVIIFMMVLGLVFTTFLQASLTSVIAVVSPAAFLLLAIVSLLLIADVDLSRFLPQVHAPVLKNPYLSAFVFGFFFGAVVIPCNPLFIAALFAKTLSSVEFVFNMLNFFAFGIGMSFPLLVLSALSAASGGAAMAFLARHRRAINMLSGLVMLGVSLYYLIFVFRIAG